MKTRPRKVIAVVGAFATAAALTDALSSVVATASPPTPLLTKLSDLARAQMVEGGHVATPSGSDAVSSLYTFAPGTSGGWTTQSGASVLAVTKGALTLRTAKDCAAKKYEAGQAALVPAGKYLVANAGSEPLEFAGVFSKLDQKAAKPLVGVAAGTAPAACKGSGFAAASTSTAGVSEFVRGTLVPLAAYGKSLHAKTAGGITVEAGKDMLIGSYTLLPGFSSGWATHMPAITIVSRGTFTYYEARDGGCVKSEEYVPGQAYTHVGGLHMGVNEGDEPVDLVIIYFNLPHGGVGQMVPGVGNTMDGIDFTPLPPAECPRLK